MVNEDACESIDFAISHNREDLELARSILRRLEVAGLIGWIDSRAFYSPAVSAERQIERAFRKARFIVLLVSNKYRDSAWCQEEYNFGIRSEAHLLVTRVVVAVESSEAEVLVPEVLNGAPRFNCSSDLEMQRICDLIACHNRTSSQLTDWYERERLGASTLVSRLPTSERLKLVGDHLEFLLLNFTAGTIDTQNHQSAIRLELTAGPPNPHAIHLSPAMIIEMCWGWSAEIIGKYRLSRYLNDGGIDEDMSCLYLSDIKLLFERILPIYIDYLAVASHRGKHAPKISEVDLVAILDYVICGFLAVMYKSDQCESHLIEGVRELLKTVANYGDRRCADVADYLDAGLPTIGLPSFKVSRGMRVYELLRGGQPRRPCL